jgi:uncharacterized membrane protein
MISKSDAPPERPDATLKPPQFTLRTLLVAMTVVGGLLAVMTAIGALWSLAILLVASLVAAHVLGNAVGTRLRDRSTELSRDAPGTPPRPTTRPRYLPGPRRLTEPARLHWIALVLTVVGAGVGSYVGGSALAANYPEATMAALVLGYGSSAVLGGFAAFATSSFVSVARQAWSEAHAASDKHPRVRRGE